MRLFIAEKPSMGKAIAACLSGEERKSRGYISVGSDAVTWCVGHLLELVKPEAYKPEWKSWSLDQLPIIPDDMRLQPTSDDAKSQLAVIKSLLAKADVVVHAGDPGREGQLIVDEVLLYLKNRKPVQRLLLNATDPATIKKQLQRLEDNKVYQSLYEAAKCRAEADWLVGMNFTRAATRAFGTYGSLISIGRVQTPTLALVVNRCKLIENFVPRTFYEIEGKIRAESGATVLMRHAPANDEQRLWDQEEANALAEMAKGRCGPLSVNTARKKVAPPKLHTLATLQQEGNKRYKWSASQTLAMAQELYVMGCLSYPRTECHYLPPEQIADIPSVMAAIAQAPESTLASVAAKITDPQPRKTVFSAKGMEGEEHHAIIPTGKPLPPGVTGSQRDLYRLVAMRYMLSLCPDYEHDETQVALKIEGLEFRAKGTVPKVLGWKAHVTDKPSEVILPPLRNEEDACVQATRLVERQTTPPDYYTEGTLIKDMAAIGKYVTNPTVKAILKETSGIGTSATQADTIETLKRREYIVLKDKGHLIDTQMGRKIIESLPTALTQPDMTAKWEQDFKSIAQGKKAAKEFREGIHMTITGGVKWFAQRAGKVQIEASKNTGSQAKTTGTSKKPQKKARRPKKTLKASTA